MKAKLLVQANQALKGVHHHWPDVRDRTCDSFEVAKQGVVILVGRDR